MNLGLTLLSGQILILTLFLVIILLRSLVFKYKKTYIFYNINTDMIEERKRKTKSNNYIYLGEL